MATLLDFFMRVGNASLDDATEDIVRMADPATFQTKGDLQDHFEKVLGYDPISYFPRKFLEEKLRELADIAPFSVREQIYDKMETIVCQSLECVDDLDISMLTKVLDEVLEYNVGWNSGLDDGVTIEDCIRMSLYGDSVDASDDESDFLDNDPDEEFDGEDDEEFSGF